MEVPEDIKAGDDQDKIIGEKFSMANQNYWYINVSDDNIIDLWLVWL